MKRFIKIVAIAFAIVAALILIAGIIKFNFINDDVIMPNNGVVDEKNAPAISAGNALDLSNQKLTSVPNSVYNQRNLVSLDISNNLLTGSLQAEIRNLQNLKVLKADHNLMTGVPAEIGQLQNLQILDLSNNKLTGLPNELGNLKNLKTFNISGNNYSTLDLDQIIKSLPAGVEIIR